MATNKQLCRYIALLLIVSWVIQLLAIMITGDINSEAANVWLMGTMLSPLIVTLVFLNRNKPLKEKLLWKPNKQIFLTSIFAILIPILIAFAVLLTLQQLHYGESSWFYIDQSGVTISGGPFFLGKGHQSWLLFISNIVITGAVFAILNACIATGEELAWRGLLQPLLVDRYGLLKGVTLLGFVWSIWHLPILLSGYNYPENPILGGFVLFPIRLIATSYFYYWLTQKSKSFIPAAIAHGALNGIQTAIISNIQMKTAQLNENIITIIVTIIVGLVFLMISYRNNKTN